MFVYIYVVDRDFGFAPNPFHGLCTLATCKPTLRRVAQVGDWVIGMGGSRLKATGKCIFAMRISARLSFNEYWNEPAYQDKKPVRNGSLKMMVGDNIYHKEGERWLQADSHHSYADGTTNWYNVENDTQTDVVLVSEQFAYFGSAAIRIPDGVLKDLKFANGRGYRKYPLSDASRLISYILGDRLASRILGDPFDFGDASKRYSAWNDRVT